MKRGLFLAFALALTTWGLGFYLRAFFNLQTPARWLLLGYFVLDIACILYLSLEASCSLSSWLSSRRQRPSSSSS